MGILDIFGKKNKQNGAIEEYGRKEKDNYVRNTTETTNNIDMDFGDFMFVIEDVFTITGRGTVVTGRVSKGTINMGDDVCLRNSQTGKDRMVRVLGVEMFRKVLNSAREGDNVGLLLSDVKRDDVSKGDVLYK